MMMIAQRLLLTLLSIFILCISYKCNDGKHTAFVHAFGINYNYYGRVRVVGYRNINNSSSSSSSKSQMVHEDAIGSSSTRGLFFPRDIRSSTTSFTQISMNSDSSEEEATEAEDLGPQSISVLGTPLVCCCDNVRNSGIGTGFYRNGYCSTGQDDLGRHTVCVEASTEFLEYSKQVGNDLSTPVPQYMFPGLQNGDIWCLCAQRWVQAYNDGKAPKLFLRSTHEKTLTYVPIEILRKFALDGDEADEVVNNLNEQRAKLNDLLKD